MPRSGVVKDENASGDGNQEWDRLAVEHEIEITGRGKEEEDGEGGGERRSSGERRQKVNEKKGGIGKPAARLVDLKN